MPHAVSDVRAERLVREPRAPSAALGAVVAAVGVLVIVGWCGTSRRSPG
jgi:hypothetical protein